MKFGRASTGEGVETRKDARMVPIGTVPQRVATYSRSIRPISAETDSVPPMVSAAELRGLRVAPRDTVRRIHSQKTGKCEAPQGLGKVGRRLPQRHGPRAPSPAHTYKHGEHDCTACGASRRSS